MSMNNPQKYEQHNQFQKRDAEEALQNYEEKMEWKPNASIADLGCGDGLVTQTVLKKAIPKDFQEIVGLDISKGMLDYASEKYGDNKTLFYQADLSKPIPDNFKAKFDHVFSSYALQFIADQETVFKNIYELLKPGGTCLIIMMGAGPYFNTYHELAKQTKWKPRLKDVNDIMPRMFYEKDWVEGFKSMLQKIGFKEFIVEDKPSSYVHEKSRLRGMCEAGNFYRLDPTEPAYEEFFDSVMGELVESDQVEELSPNYETMRVNYSQAIVFGKK